MMAVHTPPLRLKWHVAVILFFAVTTMITAMAPPWFWSSLLPLANPTDESEFLWYLWHVKQFVTGSGDSLYHTQNIYFPTGTTLGLSVLPLLPALMFLPILLLVKGTAGLILSLNLGTLVSFTLTGYFVFLLARRISGSTWAAVVAGALVAFHPYSFKHLGHLNLLSYYWLPLFLYSLWLFWESPSWKNVLLMLFSSIACAFTSLTYFVHLVGVFVLFLAVKSTVDRGEPRQGGPWRKTVVVGACVGVTGLLAILPAVLGGPTAPVGERVVWESRFAADVIDFAIPRHGSAPGVLVSQLTGRTNSEMQGKVFLGATLVGLSILGFLRTRRRERWVWFTIATGFAILSLGTSLKIGGTIHLHGWLPFAWLRKLVPFLAEERTPERFFRTAHLALALMASWGFVSLLEFVRERSKRAASLVMPLIIALILTEYIPQDIKFWIPEVPQVYDTVAEDKNPVAVCPLPLAYGVQRHYMFYQTHHGKPIAGGRIARPSVGAGLTLRGERIERVMYEVLPRREPEMVREVKTLLAEHGVKYVVLHRDDRPILRYERDHARLSRWLDVVEKTEEATLYRVY
jgi:hypothetical protein